MESEELTTYMKVTLNSEGATPTEVTKTLKEYGWTPILGPYDYWYHWTKEYNVDDIEVESFLPNFDTVHRTLRGMNVQYSLVTYKKGTEDFSKLS